MREQQSIEPEQESGFLTSTLPLYN